MSLVVDASMTVAWLFRDERTETPQAILRRVAAEGAVVPSLWRLEVANVLRNAIRYSPSHSAVEVRLAETADTSIVEIRDYGPGVAEELLSQIFKPFFRAEESRVTNSGGIGLGLSIAMRAVQVHQGAITAENEKPGLKVRIVLPRLPSREKLATRTLNKSISV